MYVVILHSPRPDELSDRLNTRNLLAPRGLLTRTYQDEWRGIVEDPAVALDAALTALRTTDGTVGIGVGPVTASEGVCAAKNSDAGPTGPALGYARAALERCSAGQPSRNIAVEGADPALSDAVTSLLRLVARGIATRTDAEWRVVDLIVPDVRGQHQAIAQALKITPQAVSKALIRTGWHEELSGRSAAIELLRRLDTSGIATA